MCVVSMVMDHYTDKWKYTLPPQPVEYVPGVQVFIPTLPTQAEIDEFRKLLERAREYDRKNNEPDCELAEKRKKLLDLATELGIDISFV